MKKTALKIITLATALFMGQQALACMPKPGVKTTEIRIGSEVVGNLINTIPQSREGGSIEVELNQKAKVLILNLEEKNYLGSMSFTVTKERTKSAKLKGQFLRGGASLEVVINENVLHFSVPLTRSMECGGAIQED